MSPVSQQGMTLSDQLTRHARHTPDQVAIRFLGEDRTYAELDERVNRLANALRERGVAPGDRVAVLTLNNPETIETYVACARLGAIVVTLNFRLAVDEIAYILNDSGATAIVVDEPLAQLVIKVREQAPLLRFCLVVGGDTEAGPGTENFLDVVNAASPAVVEHAPDDQSPWIIMYTSGTTGRPKGAVLTHHNVIINSMSLLIQLGVPHDCRVWAVNVPLFHIAGVATAVPALLCGGRMVIVPMSAFDPAAVVEMWEKERVGNAFLVPAQWQAVCDLPDIAERDLSALRGIAWGAAPATPALLRRIMAAFPDAMLYTTFGMTETSSATTVLLGEDAVEKVGSVGTPMLNVEVRIVDADMNDVPVGEVGEIVYRGPVVMKEYWNRPDATEAAFAGGWFHSGDLVRQDEDGYIYVVDRLKDMIISGGENVYCAEVENVIADHPKVAEVSVIGVPDEKWGEVPLAVIVAREAVDPPTAEEIELWCRERLAVYKCPKRVTVAEVLPRNANGKVLKSRLRDMAQSG